MNIAAESRKNDFEVEVGLGGLGLDEGGSLLLDRALIGLPAGSRIRVLGGSSNLCIHLAAWARVRGHRVDRNVVVLGDVIDRRWYGSRRAGAVRGVVEKAPAEWGLAGRSAHIELGGPSLIGADLDERRLVWTEIAPKLYAQAMAHQWDPATAVDWTPPQLPEEVEGAVVQLMTYLIENEQAALTVPARYIGRIHPHYREVIQFLATQIADEARHVEVFTRRAHLCGRELGISGAGGRASLNSLFEEPDWSIASFMLSVLGEGSFLSILAFLERNAPDPITSRIARLALQDEARHVAFAMGHLTEYVGDDPGLRRRMSTAIRRRHDALSDTAGLSRAVLESLVVIAAGEWTPEAIRRSWASVNDLQNEMNEGRRRRLIRLGFQDKEASALAELHTRNFM